VKSEQRPESEPPSRTAAEGEAVGADYLAQIRVPLDVDGVPGALKSIAQWVGWRIKAPDKPGGKVGKVPVNPHTGRDASTTNPASWGNAISLHAVRSGPTSAWAASIFAGKSAAS
jgi:hypothetical protein